MTDAILVADTGEKHISASTTARWVASFIGGRSRGMWKEAERANERLADAIASSAWDAAARFLLAETEIRRSLTPDAFTERMINSLSEHPTQGAGRGSLVVGAEDASGPLDHPTGFKC